MYNDQNVVGPRNYLFLDNGRETTIKEDIDMSSEAIQNLRTDNKLYHFDYWCAVCRKRKSTLTAVICICILAVVVFAAIKNHSKLPISK